MPVQWPLLIQHTFSYLTLPIILTSILADLRILSETPEMRKLGMPLPLSAELCVRRVRAVPSG